MMKPTLDPSGQNKIPRSLNSVSADLRSNNNLFNGFESNRTEALES
jgi:hypothetical protein